MKKSFNYLLILSIICLALITVLNFSALKVNNYDFALTNEVVEEVNENSDNPGSGWWLLFGGGVALFADFMVLSFLVLVVFIPISLSMFIVVLQGIARLFQIGTYKKWKKTIGIVLTVISIISQILISTMLTISLIFVELFSVLILLISLGISITSIVLFIKKLSNMEEDKNILMENSSNVTPQNIYNDQVENIQ